MKGKDEFIKIFSMNIRNILQKTKIDLKELQEIRLRAGKPLLVMAGGREYFVTAGGSLTEEELVYPPGIPLLAPGERVTGEIRDILRRVFRT